MTESDFSHPKPNALRGKRSEKSQNNYLDQNTDISEKKKLLEQLTAKGLLFPQIL